MAAELIEAMQKLLEELNAIADTQKGRVEHYETRLQNIYNYCLPCLVSSLLLFSLKLLLIPLFFIAKIGGWFVL